MMLGIGVFVFLIKRLGFHPGPIGLGLILGPIIEPALVQAMYVADATSVGNVFFSGTLNIILIALTVLSISVVVWTQWKGQALERAGASAEDKSGG
jgi:putative tricarboxylic transport membrane protein